jgi:hypothetical protein
VQHTHRRHLDRWRGVPGTPVGERPQQREQVRARLGQQVLVACPVAVAVGDLHEHARLDETAESCRQDVVSDAEAPLERVEASDAAGRVAQDEQRPAVAEQVSGPADRARAGGMVCG